MVQRVGAALIAFVLSGTVFSQQVNRLPEPAGPYAIGRIAFDWVDAKRLDPFEPDRKEFRRLMVYLWYPAGPGAKTDRAAYLPGARRIDATPGFTSARFGTVWPLIVSGAITSHAGDNAPVATGRKAWPVVVFSHGDGATSFSYTTAIEDLVSHGYVVAAVEHPFTSAALAFPGGRVVASETRRTLRGDRPAGVPYFAGVEIAMRDVRQVAGIQAADLRFALDQLVALNGSTSSVLSGALDLSRVAAVGHSVGGMAAVRACQQDARLKSCANLDGGTSDGVFLQYPDVAPLKQPLLYVEATSPPTFTDQQLTERGISRAAWDANVNTIAETGERQLRSGLGGGYKVVLLARGINHFSFTDVSLNATSPEAEKQALHNVRLTADVTRAFLDTYAKGERSTLLAAEGSARSELRITRYEPSHP